MNRLSVSVAAYVFTIVRMVLPFKNREFGMQVVIPEESKTNVKEELAGLCPTGALVFSRLRKIWNYEMGELIYVHGRSIGWL